MVLEIPNQTELILLEKRLSLAGIPHVLIREVDPPYDGQCTAIGVCPLSDRSVVKKLFSKLNLFNPGNRAGIVCPESVGQT